MRNLMKWYGKLQYSIARRAEVKNRYKVDIAFNNGLLFLC